MKRTELYTLAAQVHAENILAGWWTNLSTGESMLETRNRPEMLMLVVSELAEGQEGHELELNDDHLPQYAMEKVEIADAIIRLLDLLGAELSRGLADPIDLPQVPQVMLENASIYNRQYFANTLLGVRILSNAMEAWRKGRLEEYVGNLILCLNFLYNLYPREEIDQIILDKRNYNKERQDHKLHNRVLSGGKKF